MAPYSFVGFAKLLERSSTSPVGIALTALERLRNTVDRDAWTSSHGLSAREAGAIVLAAFYRDEVEPPGDRIPIGNTLEADRMSSFVLARVGTRWADEPGDGVRVALQLLCNQGNLQTDVGFKLFRSLYLLELEPEASCAQSSYLDPLFRDAFGCSTRQYVALMWILWAASFRSGPIMEPHMLVSKSPDRDSLGLIAARILAANSLPANRVKRTIDERYCGHDLEGVVPAFFGRFPFIEFKPGTYLAGPHPYVRDAAFGHPWLRALDLARGAARARGEKRPEITVESQRMGARLEQLTRWLLARITRDVVPEHVYKELPRGLSPDFLAFEDDGRDVTLVQAKLKRLSPGAFFGFDVGVFEADAANAIAETIWKSIRYLFELEANARHLTPIGADVAERVRRSRRILLLGVLPAAPSLFHVDRFRRSVETGIEAKLTKDEKTWRAANAHRLVGWHVMDAAELAEFAAWRRDEGLLDSLRNCLSLDDFGKLLTRTGSIVLPFHGYFANVARARGHMRTFPEVDECVRRFEEYTLRHLFPSLEEVE